jgi:hypothetical protein
MTLQACAANQKEGGHLRCLGCSGLDASFRKIERPLPAAASEPESEMESTDALSMALATALQEVMDDSPAVKDEPVDDFEDGEDTPPPRSIVKACVDNRDPLMRLLLVGLQNTMEDESREQYPALTGSPVASQQLDDELLSLFPEMADLIEEVDDEPPEPRRKLHHAEDTRKSYAVYMGRCERCQGYMVRDIEGQFSKRDDDVHRCFTCGWRTSPVYEWNRH